MSFWIDCMGLCSLWSKIVSSEESEPVHIHVLTHISQIKPLHHNGKVRKCLLWWPAWGLGVVDVGRSGQRGGWAAGWTSSGRGWDQPRWTRPDPNTHPSPAWSALPGLLGFASVMQIWLVLLGWLLKSPYSELCCSYFLPCIDMAQACAG